MLEVVKGRPSRPNVPSASAAPNGANGGGAVSVAGAASGSARVGGAPAGTPLLPERVPSTFGAMDWEGDKRFVRVRVRPTFV